MDENHKTALKAIVARVNRDFGDPALALYVSNGVAHGADNGGAEQTAVDCLQIARLALADYREETDTERLRRHQTTSPEQE